MYRTILFASRSPAAFAVRPLSTSRVVRESAREKMRGVADTVNKSVGRRLASAIETGEQATNKATATVLDAMKDAGDKAGKMGDIAGQKADKAGGEAKAAKEEVEDAIRK